MCTALFTPTDLLFRMYNIFTGFLIMQEKANLGNLITRTKDFYMLNKDKRYVRLRHISGVGVGLIMSSFLHGLI